MGNYLPQPTFIFAANQEVNHNDTTDTTEIHVVPVVSSWLIFKQFFAQGEFSTAARLTPKNERSGRKEVEERGVIQTTFSASLQDKPVKTCFLDTLF